MKNFTYTFLLFLTVSQALLYAQKLKLYYNLEFIKDTITKTKDNRSMILLMENENYIFCSENILVKDSLKRNNFEYSPVLMDNEVEFMVTKTQNSINKFFLIDDVLYSMAENPEILNWIIQKDKKKIENMQCQLAILNYKGRTWQAWFSTDYSVMIGPYIFSGLPGVIVELRDTKDNYVFKLDKIIKSKENFQHLINKKTWITEKPIHISKKQLENAYVSLYNDPFKRMKEKKIIYMIDEKTGEHQAPPNFDKMIKSAQKFIRENNNPIEISEAIIYK